MRSYGGFSMRRNWAVLPRDRKSTRLNSSHANISYAVFCLKKKSHSTLPHDHLLRSMETMPPSKTNHDVNAPNVDAAQTSRPDDRSLRFSVSTRHQPHNLPL